MMNCPICNNQNFKAEHNHCSACETDLNVLKDIQGVRKQMSNRLKWSMVFAFCFCLVSAGWAMNAFLFSPETVQNAEITNTKQVTGLNERMKQLSEENKALKKRIDEMKEKSASPKEIHLTGNASADADDVIHYRVKKNESLWEIAEDFLGDGNRYKEIAKENGLTNPDLIIKGTELTIHKQKN